MKKGLLLSVVATGFIFAGGNIAPVAPVAPQVAPAACDFWGQIGARYEFYKKSDKANKWGKEDNTWKTTVVLGVNKDLGYGFGLGAEVAATTGFGLKIVEPKTKESAELSEIYLTYKTGNTAIKAGRQALPKSLSPWAWTDSTLGRKDTTYEGVVVVNTDLADTTLVGAWIAKAGTGATFNNVNGKNAKGLFLLAAQNKSIANTTLTGSLYYVTEAKITSAWASAETKAGSANLGLQVAYAKAKGSKATTAVAANVGTNFNGLDAKLTLAYIKAGGMTLNIGGTSAFWGNSFAAFGGDKLENGSKQTIARLDLGYKIDGYGKVYGGVAYDKVKDSKTDKMMAAALGYKFKVAGVNAHVQYRYIKKDMTNGTSVKQNRVRVEGVYKF